MSVIEIRSAIESIAGEDALLREEDYSGRAEAIDFLEFGVLDRIDGLLMEAGTDGGLLALRARAESLKRSLESIDEALFRRLRAEIRAAGGAGKGFRELLLRYAGAGTGVGIGRGVGYDHLDGFVNGLLCPRPIPAETRAREPGMVYYQKTPARIVLEMAEIARPAVDDVFFDLGSGLGQVPILFHLLGGTAAFGVEIEPAYCGYSRACADDLALPRVRFLEGDLREADYSEGSLFFLYTPCEGKMLREVLAKVLDSAGRPFKLFTFGPCTSEVSRESRLAPFGARGAEGAGGFGPDELGVFTRA